MSVCVLGATGFIGGQIARAAVERGWSVRGLRRRPDAVGAVGDLEVEWFDGNLTDADALRAAMAGCEVVFHAAAFAPYDLRDIRKAVREATVQIRSVLSAARATGVGRVIFTSSLTTIGPPSEPDRIANERDFYLPGSVDSSYYECKWAMEAECTRAVVEGLPVVMLLPTAVFGPGDVRPSTGRLLLEVAKGRMPVSVDVPMNVVDGRDVAAAHFAAAERGVPGERYILGGHNTTVPEFFALIARLAGRRTPLTLRLGLVNTLFDLGAALRVPVPETVRTFRYLQHLDSGKAQHKLGLTTRSLEGTVRDTLDWFRQHGYL
jgi:dihydroflavonol-4-reductase